MQKIIIEITYKTENSKEKKTLVRKYGNVYEIDACLSQAIRVLKARCSNNDDRVEKITGVTIKEIK